MRTIEIGDSGCTSLDCMDLIEVILANYRFKFRRLFWKEEFALDMKGRDARRVVLAAALVEVSGLKINSFEEAWKVIGPDTLPTPILYRVFMIYKGKQPENRRFSTKNLYKAPEPAIYGKRLADEESRVEQGVDSVLRRMEQQFGPKELAEAAEIDRQIVEGSKKVAEGRKKPTGPYRGAIPKMVDEETSPLGGYKVKPSDEETSPLGGYKVKPSDG